MKIYILPINPELQPANQALEYPVGNPDFGVEQDFLDYLKTSPYLTNVPEDADWHYLPVFWTRWHINHNYGKTGLSELNEKTSRALIDRNKTFTVCQYDDGPVIDLGRIRLFLASRKSEQGYDIPLLRNRLKTSLLQPRKKYLASFVGRISTHPVRKAMSLALKDNSKIIISDGDKGQKFFLDTTLRSYVALCPRGYGGSSFRFFEAMQLGVVPLLVGDIDTRPFKNFIDWDNISLFTKDPKQIPNILENTSISKLRKMGSKAKASYLKHLQYKKWCEFVIKELEVTV